jgi:hypothetical protein
MKIKDKNGEPLYTTINNMPSSIIHHGPMIHHYELDLFYDTLVVCDYSKCRGLKVNSRSVILSHYVNDQLPKFHGLAPPISIKDLIGSIEKTHRNTSICSYFEKLEAKSIVFCLKSTKSSPFVEST